MREINNLKIFLMIKKKFILIIFFFSTIFFFQTSLNCQENKIILKINNEIITNLDVKNEINYLVSLNPNLKQLSRTELIRISKKSLIQEKIKNIELKKNFENPNLPDKYLEELLKTVYIKIGIKSTDEFKSYLKLRKIDYEDVLLKIQTEALWNELILSKFSSKIKIDIKKLKEKLKKNIGKKVRVYLMSEIFFQVNMDENIQNKYNKIIKSIQNTGFENTAVKYSISETSNMGGKLDWINENSLNKEIRSKLKLKKINEFTEPITVPGGFLILKINDIKLINSKKDIDEELKKLIFATRNNQLNQFSKMYYNKIKEDVEINEI